MQSFPSVVKLLIQQAKTKYARKREQELFVIEAIEGTIAKRVTSDLNATLLVTGETALHLLLREGFEDCAELLIYTYRLDTSIQDKHKISAVDLIIKNGNEDMLAKVLSLQMLTNAKERSELKTAMLKLRSHSPKDILSTLRMIKVLIESRVVLYTQANYKEFRILLSQAFERYKKQNSDTESIEFQEVNSLIKTASDFVEKKFPMAMEQKMVAVAKQLRFGFR